MTYTIKNRPIASSKCNVTFFAEAKKVWEKFQPQYRL